MTRVIPNWNDVYYADATDALIDLCDAMADGTDLNIDDIRNRLCSACKGRWILPGLLANPILEDLAAASFTDRDVDLTPYQTRLTEIVFQTGSKLLVPVSTLAMLLPQEFNFLITLGAAQVVEG